MNLSNGVAEIQQKYEREREKVGERKFWISIITLPKFLLTENQLWQCDCRNREKSFFFFLWQLWQCHCRKWEEKKKIMVAKIWGGIKKTNATSTIFLQHFHNKSLVISYFFPLLFRQCYCHKSTPLFFFFFFFFKKWCAHNFYNIFTTNFKC